MAWLSMNSRSRIKFEGTTPLHSSIYYLFKRCRILFCFLVLSTWFLPKLPVTPRILKFHDDVHLTVFLHYLCLFGWCFQYRGVTFSSLLYWKHLLLSEQHIKSIRWIIIIYLYVFYFFAIVAVNFLRLDLSSPSTVSYFMILKFHLTSLFFSSHSTVFLFYGCRSFLC